MITSPSSAVPELLTDEQLRAYIANGYIKIETPSVPAQVHAAIAGKLDRMLELGPNLGNNVLPHTPEFRHVLNCPEVRGALTSLLGEDYIEHPHRYCHNSSPAQEKPEDMVAAVGKRAHQDSYTPMGQPRQHLPRFARIIYYPQDTPIELGPTHVTPGTALHQRVTDEDRVNSTPMLGPAGSLWITHFDVVHAAGINLTDTVRQMIKFIYVQRNERTAPSWNCVDDRWSNPDDLQSPWDLEIAWSQTWDWMCGKRDRYQSFRLNHGANATGDVGEWAQSLNPERPLDEQLAAIRQLAAFGPAAADAVPALMALLNKDHQAARAAATYALGAIGEAAVSPLIERLKEAGEKGWDDQAPCWNEGSVTMMDEAHALAAIGTPAVAALIELVDTAGEWGRLNAAFALGEMDSKAAEAVAALTRCLEDDSHRIVRTALDALGTIGGDAACAVPRMARFLSESKPEWEEVLTGKRRWIARDQVRVNVAEAVSRLGSQAIAAEEALIGALDDECGYVALYATDALRHLGTPRGQQAVMDLVMAQRWDCSLYESRPW